MVLKEKAMGLVKDIVLNRLALFFMGFTGGALSYVWLEGVDTLCRAAGYIQVVN